MSISEPLIMIYPYKITSKRRAMYALWEDRDSGGDKFIVSQETGIVITVPTLAEIKNLVHEKGLVVDWSNVGKIDIDCLEDILLSMIAGQACSVESCRTLLEGWNFIEDYTKSTSSNSRLLLPPSSVYDKLFYGNNLPAVTPVTRFSVPIVLRPLIARIVSTGIKSAL